MLKLGSLLRHSAKGSEWKDHKYIDKKNGEYYYPDSYEGGRHLSDEDREKLANETIRGNYGNGQVRKDKLGANYQEVQSRVNEILGVSKNTSINKASDSDKKKAKDATKKAAGAKIDINKVLAGTRKR